MDIALFLVVGAGAVAVTLLVGFKIIRTFEFDRVTTWAAVADWAHANEAAARHRLSMRSAKPWREWQAAKEVV